jgi:hypothetical protein
MKISCWSCGHDWEFSPPLGRGELCSGCRRDAKVCRNCRHYDPYASRECTESQAEVVKDKEKSNFCDWFEPSSVRSAQSKDQGVNPLDALFGNASAPRSKSKLEEELESFFKGK